MSALHGLVLMIYLELCWAAMDRFLLNDVKYMQDLLVPQGEGTRYVLRPTLPAMQELCASWNVSTQICSELCDYANAVRSHRSRAHGKAGVSLHRS